MSIARGCNIANCLMPGSLLSLTSAQLSYSSLLNMDLSYKHILFHEPPIYSTYITLVKRLVKKKQTNPLRVCFGFSFSMHWFYLLSIPFVGSYNIQGLCRGRKTPSCFKKLFEVTRRWHRGDYLRSIPDISL